MLVAVLEATLDDTPHDLIMVCELFIGHWLAGFVDRSRTLAFWMKGCGICGFGEIQNWVVVSAMYPVRTADYDLSRYRMKSPGYKTYRSTGRPS